MVSSSLAEALNEDFHADGSSLEQAARISRLKLAIKNGGGNQAVAAKSRIPIGSLNNYVAGRDMKSATLVAVADACGVNIAWLAAGRGPMAPPANMAEAVLQAASVARDALYASVTTDAPTPASAPTPPSEPQNSGVFSAVVTMDADLMGKAIVQATRAFAEAGRNPNSTQLATYALALYDNMSGQLTKP